MMKPRDIEKINAFLRKWAGATAVFNKYTTTHDRFVLELVRSQNVNDFIGASFTLTRYIAGKTRWREANLVCSLWESEDGTVGYQVSDEQAGFIVKGVGSIVIGDGDEIYPSC